MRARTAASPGPARISASPTNAPSNPSARHATSVAGSPAPDSAITSRSSGTRPRSAVPRSGSTASDRRSRLLTPIRRASLDSARASSRSSCTSTSGSRPSEREMRTRRRRDRAGCSAAMRSTKSAPAARSSGSWRSSTTNSLARTGTGTAARTAARSAREPPNQCGSTSTDTIAAPPAAYARARATTSSLGDARAPAEGERRFASAMTCSPGRRSGGVASRGGAAARAARSSSRRGRSASSASTSARRRSAISPRTPSRAFHPPARAARPSAALTGSPPRAGPAPATWPRGRVHRATIAAGPAGRPPVRVRGCATRARRPRGGPGLVRRPGARPRR